MKDRQYLKIGAFSKLTGVSVKALRYYDRIGVLKPAWVDPDTGYRYYAPEQMILLDLVRLSLTFQLPLKELETGRAPDLKALIQNGEARAREKLKEAQATLRLSQDILDQLRRLDHPRSEGTPYQAFFPPRRLLLAPWSPEKDSGADYLKKQEQLHARGRSAGLTLLTQQGLLLDLEKGSAQVFLAVEGESGAALFSLPGGSYTCAVLPERSLCRVPGLLSDRGTGARFALCLNTDIYDYCLEHHLHRLELQVPDAGGSETAARTGT